MIESTVEDWNFLFSFKFVSFNVEIIAICLFSSNTESKYLSIWNN